MTTRKTDQSGTSSSDLEAARAASRALQGGTPRGAAAPTPPYTHLAPPAPPPPAAPEPPKAPVPRRPLPATLTGGAAWKQVLEECVHLSGAQEAFAVDASGLTVASTGAVQDEERQSMGARLVLAFDQADRIAARPCRLLTIELGGRTLTGLRLTAEGQEVVIGLLSRQPVTPQAQQALAAWLSASR